MKYTANETELLIEALRRAQDHAGNLAEDTEQNVRERDWWDATARELGREADRLQREYQRDQDIERGRKFARYMKPATPGTDEYFVNLGIAARRSELDEEVPF